jgi:hypothetical protein
MDNRPRKNSYVWICGYQCCGPECLYLLDPGSEFFIPDLGSKKFRIPAPDSHLRI